MAIFVSGLSTGFLIGGGAGFVVGVLFVAQLLGVV